MEKFSCLIGPKSKCNTSFQKEAELLVKAYPSDLDEEFSNELQQFTSIFDKQLSALEMLQYLKELNLSSAFPNVDIALRIFVTLPISNCSGERSFSLLKRIKSPIRCYLQQEKLSQLSVLCFNSDITAKIDFSDIIDKFSISKARKKPLKNM